MKIVYVPDIECESCVKIITKKLNKEGIDNFEIKNDGVYFNGEIDLDKVVEVIKSLNYRASLNPFERKNLKERLRHFKENKSQYSIEITGIKYFVYTFLILLGLVGVSYSLFLNQIPNFLENYLVWIVYLIISVTSIGIGLWHFFSYKTKFTCMIGMMIGMTIGMQSGMMVGVVIGATNGFFIGSVVGVIIGVVLGALAGKCCGVMGIIEGMMAGIMGGTMGPMISVMMFSDHLLWFMPLYMLVNVMILIGFSYMLYEEVVEGKNLIKQPLDLVSFCSLSVIVTFILISVMVYGPKSALIGF